MPGPAPQPTELKRRRGNPGKRKLNLREPKPDVGLPQVPASLSPGAQAVWQKLGPLLVRIGVLTEADGQAFGDLCATEAVFRRMAAELDTMPLDGAALGRFLGVVRERRAQHAGFGMTPASRSKIIGAPNADKVDPIEQAIADYASMHAWSEFDSSE